MFNVSNYSIPIMNVFDRRYEMMPRAELEQLQLERLQALLVRLKRNVRRAREKIGDTRVESLADLSRLPFTTPEDMVESFPYGMFALPMREIIRLHTTTGPQGKPLVIGHTRNDLAQWGRLAARQLVAFGVTANDVVQMCFGGGVYGAAGYLFGAQVIEASVIAEDSAHVDYQIATLQNFQPTVLITTPGNALDLMQVMEQRRLDPQSLHIRTVLLSRPVDEETRERLAAGLFAGVKCNFGLGEILNPGLCVECSAGHFHVHEDHFLPEVQDGELVLTTLCREALPLLRYRTRVRCEITREKCSCGRTGAIIVPGERLDGRLRINETSLYQDQIAEVLARTKVAGQPFNVTVSERRISVSVEISDDLFDDTVGFIEELTREIESEFLARLGIEADVRFIPPHSRTVVDDDSETED
jgi:phenylacetate-CoA ligase